MKDFLFTFLCGFILYATGFNYAVKKLYNLKSNSEIKILPITDCVLFLLVSVTISDMIGKMLIEKEVYENQFTHSAIICYAYALTFLSNKYVPKFLVKLLLVSAATMSASVNF